MSPKSQHESGLCRKQMRKKMDLLLNRRRIQDTPDDRCVINLSSKKLSHSQQSILSEGLNFALAPKMIPVLCIIAAVDDGLRSVSDVTTVSIRLKVVGLIKKAKLPDSNVTPDESRATY